MVKGKHGVKTAYRLKELACPCREDDKEYSEYADCLELLRMKKWEMRYHNVFTDLSIITTETNERFASPIGGDQHFYKPLSYVISP